MSAVLSFASEELEVSCCFEKHESGQIFENVLYLYTALNPNLAEQTRIRSSQESL